MTNVTNPAGGIDGTAIELIRTELPKGGASRFLVNGEEDLLVLPVVLFAGNGTDVFYGQPNEGMVHVKVSPDAKKRVTGLLSLMGYQGIGSRGPLRFIGPSTIRFLNARAGRRWLTCPCSGRNCSRTLS